jgi:hypothetical protein
VDGPLLPRAGEESVDEEEEEESEGDAEGEEGWGDEGGCVDWELDVLVELLARGREGEEACRGDKVVETAVNVESRESLEDEDDCRSGEGDEERDEDKGMKEVVDVESEGEGEEPGEGVRVDTPGNLMVIFRLRLVPVPGEGVGEDDRRAGDEPPTTTEIFLEAVGVEGAGVPLSSIS